MIITGVFAGIGMLASLFGLIWGLASLWCWWSRMDEKLYLHEKWIKDLETRFEKVLKVAIEENKKVSKNV